MNYIAIKKTAYHEVGELSEVILDGTHGAYFRIYKDGEVVMLVHEDDIDEYYKPLEDHRNEIIDKIL